MSTDIAVVDKEEDVFIQENVISLKGFPSVLKKVGKYILESDKPVTITEVAKELDIAPPTIYTAMFRARKKGKDFQKFIDQHSADYLRVSKLGVMRALVSGAVSDSHADRKLYFQLTGDLKENTGNTTQITLNVGINAIPQAAVMQAEEKGIVDVEPVIPEDD